MAKIISISVNDEDLRRVDDYCHAHNLTRFNVRLAISNRENSRF